MNSSLNVRCRNLSVILFLGAAFVVARPATGLAGSEAERAAAFLPAESRAVVGWLLSLVQLPAGTWKMHSGDLAHGEAVNLDDSIWLNMVVGALVPTDAVWFRQTFQVPDTLHGYDLTGARIWFQFHANANGPMPKLLQYSDHPQRRQ